MFFKDFLPVNILAYLRYSTTQWYEFLRKKSKGFDEKVCISGGENEGKISLDCPMGHRLKFLIGTFRADLISLKVMPLCVP